MRVLIVGGGGREHALAWKIAHSTRVERLFVAPGNAGTAREPKTTNVPIAAENIAELRTFAAAEAIDLTIVGPEAPLVAGIVDEFMAAHLTILGPTRATAQIEGSKRFAKDFLAEHQIPTAAYASFTRPAEAIAYIRSRGAPIVVKADGLAAGKGVIVALTEEEAINAANAMLHSHIFGAAGHRVVIEEFLTGEEASFICMVDGKHILPLATSQDHKARDNGDLGPNTGGMGAYSPAPVITPTLHDRVMREVIEPTVEGMAARGHPYTGFLYAGLMITPEGDPKVLEFNCRLGDPETQPILLRLQSDLLSLCLAAAEGTLAGMKPQWDSRAAVGVVMTASGYPGAYIKGEPIVGLPAQEAEGVKIFQAGTALRGREIVTNGGRVLCVTGLGETIETARLRAYQQARAIYWNGVHFRTDIGHRALARGVAPF